MSGRILWAAYLALALAIPRGDLLAQTSYTPSESQQPPPILVPPMPPPAPRAPTVIIPPQASPSLPAPAGVDRPPAPSATFCCTANGRFGPVGGGSPGAPCQWSLPSGVAQGSTCN
jgi:hypothetical protein